MTVLSELAALHAIVSHHQEFAIRMVGRLTDEEKILLKERIATKQRALYEELLRRSGLTVDPPDSPGGRG